MAQIIGYIALGLLVISLQQRTRRGLVFIQIFSTTLFSIHFAMLGVQTGCLLNVIHIVRAVVFYNSDKPWASGRRWMYILLAAFTLATVISWQGPLDLLPMFACYIYTVGTYIENPRRMRSVLWLSSVAWIIYNYNMHSMPGMLAEILALLSLVTAMIRLDLPAVIKARRES